MDQLPADTLRIPVDALTGLVRDVFVAAGCDAAEAGRIATHLVGANLAGHDSHGVVRVPRYVEWLEAGFVVKGQDAEIVTDGGAFALLDGKWASARRWRRRPCPRHRARAATRCRRHGAAQRGPYRPRRGLRGTGDRRGVDLHPLRQCRG